MTRRAPFNLISKFLNILKLIKSGTINNFSNFQLWVTLRTILSSNSDFPTIFYPGTCFQMDRLWFLHDVKNFIKMTLSSSTFVPGFDLNISRIWTASQVQTLAMMFPEIRSSPNHALIGTEFSHSSKFWPQVINWEPAVNRQPGYRRNDS